MSPKRPLFREVNDRIREVNALLGPPEAGHEILFCECGRDGCAQRLEVPGDVYDVVRSGDRRFLVAPGHEAPDAELVVAGSPSYVVIAHRPAVV
jgi:hypothetical protein